MKQFTFVLVAGLVAVGVAAPAGNSPAKQGNQGQDIAQTANDLVQGLAGGKANGSAKGVLDMVGGLVGRDATVDTEAALLEAERKEDEE